MGPFKDAWKGQWGQIFSDPIDVESLAKGKWSTSINNPDKDYGYRRYGAGKLCEVMML